MSSRIGTLFQVSLFGQSHGAGIGCLIEGIPAGMHLDWEAVQKFLARRSGRTLPGSTPRAETDIPQVISGLNAEGYTCGAPLCVIIENTNTRSQDYTRHASVPRPSHADYPAQVKWDGHADLRGGGHFSARITTALCVAGSIAQQVLKHNGISIVAHVAELAGITDESFDAYSAQAAETSYEHLLKQCKTLNESSFPVIDQSIASHMDAAIKEAQHQHDSLGGIVEAVVLGMPLSLGEPHFDSLESLIARGLFGIPAVKGVEFGEGFRAARMKGSEHNDPWVLKDSSVQPGSNHAGGILGGISTGAPLVVRAAFKPIASISQPQRSVDLTTETETTFTVCGRHDATAVMRAVPVVEAMLACTVLDAFLMANHSRPTF